MHPRRSRHARLSLLLALVFAAPQAAAAPAKVLIVGTFHFANPGQDVHNVQADDVLAARRQAEIAAVVDGLARFAPTQVLVEQRAVDSERDYAAYRAGTLAESRNEVVQLGYRLAARQQLSTVHGIDMPGEFPLQPVIDWATANGREAAYSALMAQAGGIVARIDAQLREGSIGTVLRQMNATDDIATAQAFYLALLQFGHGDQQPGAELNAAWQARNFRICARLLQALKPGDRAVVFYGQGHAHALQRCVIEAPGFELVDALDYLAE